MVARHEDKMKWLILGGGQLAKALEVELQAYDVSFQSLNHSQLDITNEKQVHDVIFKELPDILVNAAAWTNVDLAEKHEAEARLVNALGPEILARASSRIESLFVHISTDYVFSGNSRTPWKEEAVTAPSSAYGRTKAEGEVRVLKTYGENAYVIRTAWLYSHLGKNFVKTMAKIALQEDREVEVVSDQVGQPTLAYDLASRIRLLVEADSRPGIYHATNSGSTSRFELARFIFKHCGTSPDRVKPIKTMSSTTLARRPEFSVLGNEKSLGDGLRPMRDWREALEDALPRIISRLD